MDKVKLIEQIIKQLKLVHQNAVKAAMLAYNSATDKENVAENKYDTLGLEAGYLAQGQAARVDECANDLVKFENMDINRFTSETAISVSALVGLLDEDDIESYVFIGPSAGGLKVEFEGKSIVIITSNAPLGKALIGRFVDDEIALVVGSDKHYYVVSSVY